MGKPKGPIRWFGGKGNMVAKLLKLVPPHRRYIEVFGGGGALLFNKEPADLEVYNDIDGGLVGFFRVLQDPKLFPELLRRLSVTLYSRQEYMDARAVWQDEIDPISKAHKWYIVTRMSFSGRFGASWSSVVTEASQKGGNAAKFLSAVDSLPRFHNRISRVQIEAADFRNIIKRYDTPDTLFYLDPPYAHSTRSAGKYAHELTDSDHTDLIGLILNVKGSVMLSGYSNPIYDALSDWYRVDFKTACYAAGRTKASGILGKGSATAKQKRVETVWMNYEVPK